MKKIISLILVIGLFASVLTTTALAFDIDETYDDVFMTKESFDAVAGSGIAGELSTDNSPDGTKYNTFTTTDYRGSYIEFGDLGNSDAVWEMDVKFNQTDTNGTNGSNGAGFAINNAKNEVSLVFHKNGQLYIRKGSGTTIGDNKDFASVSPDVDLDSWYRIVVYGRYPGTSGFVGGMDLYKYNPDGTKTKIEGTTWTNRNVNQPDRMYFYNNISVDNLTVYKMYPNKVEVKGVVPGTETGANINAGATVSLAATAYRDTHAVKKPTFSWEFYDEANENPITPTGVTLVPGTEANSDMCNVITAVDAPDQTFNVRATTTTKSKPFVAYPVTVSAVDVGELKFDEIEITPSAETTIAGETIDFEVAAKKNGMPVTDLEAGDVLWKVYGSDGIYENNNKLITFNKADSVWTMGVNKDVISQGIKVMASDAGGIAMSNKCDIIIKNTDMLNADDTGTGDKLILSETCDTLNTEFTSGFGSGDGSNYYTTKVDKMMHNVGSSSGSTSDDMIIESDLMFTDNGQGWVSFRGDGGNLGLQVTYNDGSLKGSTGSSSSVTLAQGIELNQWYHLKQVSSSGGSASYVHLWIYKYEADGTRTVVAEMKDAGYLRGQAGNAFGRFTIHKGTSFDNFRMAKASPNGVKISVDGDKTSATAGSTVIFNTEVTKWGATMKTQKADCVAFVDGLPADKESFELITTEDGKTALKIASLATDCEVEVKATILGGEYMDSVKIKVISSDVYQVNGIDLSPEGDRVTRINVTKKSEYIDETTFIIATYSKDGILLGMSIKPYDSKFMNIDEQSHVPVNFTLPTGFDKDNDILKVFVWTKL